VSGYDDKHNGMDATLEAENAFWRVRAQEEAEAYLYDELKVGSTFTGESLCRYIEAAIGPPPTPQVWGAVCSRAYRRWLDADLIAEVGLKPSKRRNNHAHRYAVYEVLPHED